MTLDHLEAMAEIIACNGNTTERVMARAFLLLLRHTNKECQYTFDAAVRERNMHLEEPP